MDGSLRDSSILIRAQRMNIYLFALLLELPHAHQAQRSWHKSVHTRNTRLIYGNVSDQILTYGPPHYFQYQIDLTRSLLIRPQQESNNKSQQAPKELYFCWECGSQHPELPMI